MSLDTDLKTALQDGPLDAVASAIFKSNNLEIEDEIGWTPLFYGVARGDARMVQLLLDAGANPMHLDLAGWSAFMHAVADDKPWIVKVLQRSTFAM